MQQDPGGGAEDQEPESRRPGSAPPKKPLAVFLAEFEQHLLDHPEASATSALQVVEDRAGGQRRSALPGVTTRGPAPQDLVPDPATTDPPAPSLSPPPPTPSPGTVATPGTPEALAEAEGPAADGGSDPPGASAEATAESRRLRGRRRRRHRHRAH